MVEERRCITHFAAVVEQSLKRKDQILAFRERVCTLEHRELAVLPLKVECRLDSKQNHLDPFRSHILEEVAYEP
jgi:hypothetical protein